MGNRESEVLKIVSENSGGLKRETGAVSRNAIILAAGMGLGMIPLNTEMPKGMIEVYGERLVERLIRQLNDAGVCDITVVIGYMKEKYEHLKTDFGVSLVEVHDYTIKNNLHSLAAAADKIHNTYIVPSDVWCRINPFEFETDESWYMTKGNANTLTGIAYISEANAADVCGRLKELAQDEMSDDMNWEECLIQNSSFVIPSKVVSDDDVVEIDTFEQLRCLDENSEQLEVPAILTIAKELGVAANEITNVIVLKKGMTNRSFRFSCRGKEYIMRIPGEGTSRLINRQQEAACYGVLSGLEICDDVTYIDPENGYKITEYFSSAKVCDPLNDDDVKTCMRFLRNFHKMGLEVDHRFDLFAQIEYYESLWGDNDSEYADYNETKAAVWCLKEYIDKYACEFCLTHIDAVSDNFLFIKNADGTEGIRLIDWEYAGMQDPHVDLAMFCVYAMYDRVQVDKLIDAYFEEGCGRETRIKIYCYIAVCGLLWSNWCEYKRMLGVEFGDYSLRQYQFAKEYCKIVAEELASAHTVKRAIIMAAGEGVRMRPVTLHTPKPLVKVNGMRMIDTVIQSLRKNGITEIYVVVGHLKEQFEALPNEYPGVKLIENPWYHSCNNISSLYVAREHLEDVIILDGDQIIYNDEILSPKFYRSGYNAVYTEKQTAEWLMTVEKDVVTGCSRTGGAGGWQLFSISRWSKEDGEKLKRQLEHEFEVNKNMQLYWDDLPMFCYPNEYSLGVREMKQADVIEIDNFEELVALDSSYLS